MISHNRYCRVDTKPQDFGLYLHERCLPRFAFYSKINDLTDTLIQKISNAIKNFFLDIANLFIYIANRINDLYLPRKIYELSRSSIPPTYLLQVTW